jgi:CRISPR/Cas system CSM-associated protein Csm3 (group 7 of RAMP superfamily)
MKNKARYIAHFRIEAATPLAIGSGEKGLTVDRLIARDVNNLPNIPGTSLTGVLRHLLEDNANESGKRVYNQIFGFQNNDKKSDGKGSDLIVSSAYLIDENGKAIEGLSDTENSDFLKHFNKLPERDHVRITDKGTADTAQHGKFDEQLVFKGTRFAFSLELEANADEQDAAFWKSIIDAFHCPTFRIGAGTRKGFGAFNLLSCKTKIFDLEKSDELNEYLNLSSSLNADISEWNDYKTETENSDWKHYKLKLIPESFYLFGAGFGNKQADAIPKTESYFVWDNEGRNPKLVDYFPEKQHFGKILIPATSIKGALAHRTAFHFNKKHESFIEKKTKIEIEDFELVKAFEQTEIANLEIEINNLLSEIEKTVNNAPIENISEEDLANFSSQYENQMQRLAEMQEKLKLLSCDEAVKNSQIWLDYETKLSEQKVNKSAFPTFTGKENEAVRKLFGYEKNTKLKEDGARGKIIFSDVYEDFSENDEHIFNHVSIDRFTGGGRDGALYSEKAVKTQKQFTMDIYVEKEAFIDENIKKAFEAALNDVTTGNLQLGGNTAKGHGVFTGNYELVK